MTKRAYILQKDLPGLRAGAKFEPVSALAYAFIQTGMFHLEFAKEFVENNPDWFKLEEPERATANVFFCDESDVPPAERGISFVVPHSYFGKIAAIKSAIESVLNDEGKEDALKGAEIILGKYGYLMKKYTQKDLDKAREDAFKKAREINDPPFRGCAETWPKYQTFEDYLKSLGK